MYRYAIVFFLALRFLAATPVSSFTCSVSAVGAGYNQSASYSGPVAASGIVNDCTLSDTPIFTTWARVNGNSLSVYVDAAGTSGLTLTAFGSLTQSQEFHQIFSGGSGDATLRMTYRWARSMAYQSPLSIATLVEPDPTFLLNGSPVAAVKTDYSHHLVCGGSSECNFWTFTVDMPITFGVWLTYGWTHTYSDFVQVTDSSGQYLGYHAEFPSTIPQPFANIQLAPYMQVIVDGNPVAFSVQDVPEPGTWALIAAGLGVAFVRSRKALRG